MWVWQVMWVFRAVASATMPATRPGARCMALPGRKMHVAHFSAMTR
jgi:hypothetical protein